MAQGENLWSHLALYFTVFVWGTALYVAGVIFYRLTLHPLAKYPGPFLAKITSLYSAYYAFVGDDRYEIQRCHEKYGELVRYGPNRLLVNTKEALKDIYGPGKNVAKSKAYIRFSMSGKTSTHSAVNKIEHGRKRRIVNQGLNSQALRDMEPMIIDEVVNLSKKLGEKDSTTSTGWTSPKNMADWANYLTFDVMGRLVFGRDFDIIDKPENRYIPASIYSATRRTGTMGAMPSLSPVYDIVERIFQPAWFKQRFRFMAAAQSIARERLAEKSGPGNDIYGKMIDAKDPETGEGFSSAELLGESMLLITAGSDTSSTGLAGLFFYLGKNPEYQKRAVSEIRSAFDGLDSIKSGSELTSCTFLKACIQESMRMTPPVGGALWREVLPGGLTIGRTLRLPAGVDVGTSIFALHHNTEYYPDPFTFDPERWIEGGKYSKDEVELAKAAYCPFSIGPRGCPGQALAMMEISLAAARILWEFDFRVAPKELGGNVGAGDPNHKNPGRRRPGEYQSKDCFTSWKEGPMIQFKAR